MSYGADKLKMGQNSTQKLNLTLEVKIDHPLNKNNRDLNQGVLHLWSNFGDPSNELSCEQARD